jgi:hypothetical protein
MNRIIHASAIVVNAIVLITSVDNTIVENAIESL